MSRVTLIFTLCVWGCACVAPLEDELEHEEAVQAGSGGAFTYFWVAPYGGSYVVARVNRGSTVCADGTVRPWCHVSALDADELGVPDDELEALELRLAEPFAVIVRGRLETISGAPTLVATEAWLAGTEGDPTGVGVLVQQTGIRCVRAPCPDKLELRLNLGWSTHIAELDFGPSGATDEQIAAALGALTFEGGDGLLVFGDRYVVCDQGTCARARTVTQFYTRLGVHAGALALTPEECEATGGFVRPDIGDGQVACEPDEEYLGRVLIGIEGGVCCAQ